MALDKTALEKAHRAYIDAALTHLTAEKCVEAAITAYLKNAPISEERVSEVAKMLADWRGHGMREKCMDIARQVLEQSP
jgi:Flp pilus assembly CpaE family ATPase